MYFKYSKLKFYETICKSYRVTRKKSLMLNKLIKKEKNSFFLRVSFPNELRLTYNSAQLVLLNRYVSILIKNGLKERAINLFINLISLFKFFYRIDFFFVLNLLFFFFRTSFYNKLSFKSGRQISKPLVSTFFAEQNSFFLGLQKTLLSHSGRNLFDRVFFEFLEGLVITDSIHYQLFVKKVQRAVDTRMAIHLKARG